MSLHVLWQSCLPQTEKGRISDSELATQQSQHVSQAKLHLPDFLCLGWRWGQTSRRIGGQGGNRRRFSSNSMTAFYPVKTARLSGIQKSMQVSYAMKRLFRDIKSLLTAEEETRGFLRSVEELAHKQRQLKLHFIYFIPSIKSRSLGLEENTWQARPKVLSFVLSMISFRSAMIATISPFYSCTSSFLRMTSAQVGWSIPSSWEANRSAQWSNPDVITKATRIISIISCLAIGVTWAFVAPGLFLVTRALLRWKSGACTMSQSSTS